MDKTHKITQAVIPAAGLGTRFLPYTKAIAKEMVPLLDKPAIQYIVEEGIASGIEHFCVITSREKESIANHFDRAYELEDILAKRGKSNLLHSLELIRQKSHFSYVRQGTPLGLGHAVVQAKQVINSPFFTVLLPDDIIIGQVPALAQLIQLAHQEQASVIAVQEVPEDMVSAYGIISIKKQLSSSIFEIADLIEKPAQQVAPSRFAIVGRYILASAIFDAIEHLPKPTSGEIQLTDAIRHLILQGHRVIAATFSGIRFDIGNPVGWLQANIHLSSLDPRFASIPTKK